MTPVMQTIEGPHGNCMSACLASLFEISVHDVPNFYDAAGDNDALWWGGLRDWLRERGFGIMSLALTDSKFLQLFEGYFIVCGKSSRGLDHATLWKDGEMVHDPHPKNEGVSNPDTVDLLYPLDVSKLRIKEE